MNAAPFHAIRLTSGDLIYGEYAWVSAGNAVGDPPDWVVAEDADHCEPVEYEMVHMVPEVLERRVYGATIPCSECDADGPDDDCPICDGDGTHTPECGYVVTYLKENET